MSLTKKTRKNRSSANNWHLEAADAGAVDAAAADATMDAFEPADAAVEALGSSEASAAVEASEAVVLSENENRPTKAKKLTITGSLDLQAVHCGARHDQRQHLHVDCNKHNAGEHLELTNGNAQGPR